MTAELDPLRDEGLEYAARLLARGCLGRAAPVRRRVPRLRTAADYGVAARDRRADRVAAPRRGDDLRSRRGSRRPDRCRHRRRLRLRRRDGPRVRPRRHVGGRARHRRGAGPETADAVAELGVAAQGLRIDVGDPQSILDAARRVDERFGGCDLLCANVGVQQFGSIDRLTDDDWNWVLGVNVMGTIRTVAAFLPQIRRRTGWRHVAITASSGVLLPAVRLAVYTTSKFAVMGYGETLRLELEPEGIGVTLVFPAGMITRHLESSALARPMPSAHRSPCPTTSRRCWRASPGRPDRASRRPEEAARDLLPQLLANVPYVITHGTYRADYELRRAEMDRAFDRMEKLRGFLAGVARVRSNGGASRVVADHSEPFSDPMPRLSSATTAPRTSGLGSGGATRVSVLRSMWWNGSSRPGISQHPFLLVRPRAVGVDRHVDPVAEGAERPVEERVRQDAVDLGAERRGQLELGGVGFGACRRRAAPGRAGSPSVSVTMPVAGSHSQ